MAENPFLKLLNVPVLQPTQDTSQTQLLSDSGPSPDAAIGDVVNSLEELAHIDTTNMEPKQAMTPSLTLKAQQKAAALILESGEEVKELCDRVDKLLESSPQLVGPPLIHVRGYVRQLMVTLKEKPEFDNILIDKDTRNIMRVARAIREEALALREVKTEKKVKRESNKEAKAEAKLANVSFAGAFAASLSKMGLPQK